MSLVTRFACWLTVLTFGAFALLGIASLNRDPLTLESRTGGGHAATWENPRGSEYELSQQPTSSQYGAEVRQIWNADLVAGDGAKRALRSTAKTPWHGSVPARGRAVRSVAGNVLQGMWGSNPHRAPPLKLNVASEEANFCGRRVAFAGEAGETSRERPAIWPGDYRIMAPGGHEDRKSSSVNAGGPRRDRGERSASTLDAARTAIRKAGRSPKSGDYANRRAVWRSLVARCGNAEVARSNRVTAPYPKQFSKRVVSAQQRASAGRPASEDDSASGSSAEQPALIGGVV